MPVDLLLIHLKSLYALNYTHPISWWKREGGVFGWFQVFLYVWECINSWPSYTGHSLKVHKHEIVLILLNSFLAYIKTLYDLSQCSKEKLIIFFRYVPAFWSSNLFAMTEDAQNQFFVRQRQEKGTKHRLNMEVDLLSLFGLHVTW
jgi:hypothetical protein